MAEVKHTPWEVVPANAHHGFYVTDVAGRTVCDLYFMDRSDIDAAVRQFDGAESNARLIAAAPDLFEALQAFSREYDGFEDGNGDPCPILKQARAALSKATAQQEGR